MKCSLLTNLAACLALTGSASAASVIHSWDFEGDYLDDVGGAHGSVTGSTTVSAGPGFAGGSAATFGVDGHGSNDFVNITTGTVSTPITGFSVTYWLNLPDDGSTASTPGGNGNRGMFDFSSGGTDSGVQGLYLRQTSALNFRIDNGANSNFSVILAPGTNVEDGEWHHIALTMTPGLASNGFQLYVDGVGITNTHSSGGSTTGFTSGDIDSLTPYFGAFNFSPTNDHGLGGSLDNFQVWDGALTPSEVATQASIPEPSTALLGLLGVTALLRRRR